MRLVGHPDKEQRLTEGTRQTTAAHTLEVTPFPNRRVGTGQRGCHAETGTTPRPYLLPRAAQEVLAPSSRALSSRLPPGAVSRNELVAGFIFRPEVAGDRIDVGD